MSMHTRARRGKPLALLLACALGLASAPEGRAQLRPPSGLPAPRLLVVSPCGAKAGATVEITCTGLNLEEPEKLVFSNPAVKAELVPTPPPPKPDPKRPAPRPRPGMAAGSMDSVKYKVTVPAGTALGALDVRVVNKWGVSNPRVFVVGDSDEVVEKEPNNDDTAAQKVALNTTVHGAIGSPTDVDYYVFSGKKGQRVVVSCLATGVDSRLQPSVEVYDKDDDLLASSYSYHHYDALTDVTVPADGDYYVRVVQFTHTLRTPLPLPAPLPPGVSDSFYRLSISTAPWIDAVHPAVLPPGKATAVTVYGRNLPGGKLDPTAKEGDSVLEKATLTVTAPADGAGKLLFSGTLPPSAATLDGFELRLKNASGSSNPFLLALAAAPVVLDNGDNDAAAKPQEVTLPCEIAGQVEKRRDRDWYAFTAKKGEAWTVEVFSNRLGAPTYMAILVRNAATKADLYESPLNESMNLYDQKFFARSEDPPAYTFTAPADGKYLLLVSSRSAATLAGPRHAYRVRVTRDQPDFRLAAVSAVSMPDAATVPAGGNAALSVLAWRDGGFAGDVELSVEGLPPGVTCPPQVLAAGVRQTTLVLSAAPDAAAWAGEVKVKGTATVGGKKVAREARTGSIVWPSQLGGQAPMISRLDRGLHLAVRGKAAFRLTPALEKAEVLQGDRTNLKVKVERLWPDVKGPLALQVMQSQQRQGSELPTNLRFNNNQLVNVAPGAAEATLNVTVGNDVPPGVYNVVLRGQTQLPYSKDPDAKVKPPTFVVLPSLPVTITVLPRSLAALSLSTTGPTVKAGAQTEVTVRVARRFNFDGEFKVKLVLPAGVAGVEAEEVTIPAGKDEAKLVIKAPEGAAPGNRANLTVRAVALFNGKTETNHDVRLSVNVTK